MRKFLTAICLFFITMSAQAAEIVFLDNPVWNTVLEKAKKENKMIFLDAYATWCGPCKKMDAETYKNQAVADYYNANFINVRYDMEKGEGKMLAEKYNVTAYPYLIFTDPAGLILHKGVGYLEAVEFNALGKAAKNPSTQYYTLKKKAMTLSSADFEKFATMGVDFEDDEIDDLMEQYLGNQTDILGDKNLMSLVMERISALPNEKALAYFKASKAKLIAAGYTADQFDERLITLTLGYSLSETAQTDPNNLNFNVIENLLTKYTADKAYFVFHYYKAQFESDKKNYDGVLNELNLIVDNTPSKVTFDQLCNAVMGLVPDLEKQGKAEAFLKKFDAVALPAKDAEKAYMKEFVRAIIAIKNGNMDQFKTLANQMLVKPSVPANVKEDLKNALARMSEGN